MQSNKSKGTKPELAVRRALWHAGLRGYRLHWKVPGHPDIAWPGKKVAVFIHGCFWHRCPTCNLPTPKSNVEYWVTKFDRNADRDARNEAALVEQGWTVHVVWECELKKKRFDETMRELVDQLAKELGKNIVA